MPPYALQMDSSSLCACRSGRRLVRRFLLGRFFVGRFLVGRLFVGRFFVGRRFVGLRVGFFVGLVVGRGLTRSTLTARGVGFGSDWYGLRYSFHASCIFAICCGVKLSMHLQAHLAFVREMYCQSGFRGAHAPAGLRECSAQSVRGALTTAMRIRARFQNTGMLEKEGHSRIVGVAHVISAVIDGAAARRHGLAHRHTVVVLQETGLQLEVFKLHIQKDAFAICLADWHWRYSLTSMPQHELTGPDSGLVSVIKSLGWLQPP